MTTIACTKECMSSDSQLTAGGTKSSTCKLFRRKGLIIGVAGDFSEALSFVDWILSGGDTPEPDMTEVEALVLSTKGIHCYDGRLVPIKLEDPFAAIGSGASAALGALHMGATPQQAIKVAAKVDAFTGGRVRSMYLTPGTAKSGTKS